jgi:uncharacterized protein YceH (UPF0502 family)
MLPRNLSPNEARIIGCLMEKSVTTPDQYPLTLNALTNACNQKSSREPVMSLPQGVVQHDARLLESNHLLMIEDGFKLGVEKYAQRFCNTSFCEFQFDAAQFAIVCLLLLRGAQTPGELRARTGRLHEFADNAAVEEALTGLIEREGDALAVQLPRTPGRKDSEYTHLFSGPVDMQAHTEKAQLDSDSRSPARVSMAELAQRVTDLEAEVAELRKLLV